MRLGAQRRAQSKTAAWMVYLLRMFSVGEKLVLTLFRYKAQIYYIIHEQTYTISVVLKFHGGGEHHREKIYLKIFLKEGGNKKKVGKYWLIITEEKAECKSKYHFRYSGKKHVEALFC